MASLDIVVAGAAGRMGRTLIRLVAGTEGVRLRGALERGESDALGRDAGLLADIGEVGVEVTADPAPLLATNVAFLDFTAPKASLRLAREVAKAGAIHVIGTTGFSPAEEQELAGAAKSAVIVKSGSMSLGVNLLAQLARTAAAALDADFDVEILEFHHRHKVDAPSGTALLLGQSAAEGRGIDLARNSVTAREGETGPRKRGDIGFAVLRGGSVVGDHSVIFAGEGEAIALTHRAFDRAIFARGALKAALWARDRKPGLYGMADVLGIAG